MSCLINVEMTPHVYISYSEIVNHGGIESLISLLSHSKDTVVSNTCVILTNMSTEEEVRSDIQRQGVISALMTPLQSKNCDVQVNFYNYMTLSTAKHVHLHYVIF